MSISDPGLVKDLLTLRRLSADLTAERRRLADNLDTLGREGRRLQRLCQDFRAGLPPLSLLLDNVHNLVLRRALRETRERRWWCCCMAPMQAP